MSEQQQQPERGAAEIRGDIFAIASAHQIHWRDQERISRLLDEYATFAAKIERRVSFPSGEGRNQ